MEPGSEAKLTCKQGWREVMVGESGGSEEGVKGEERETAPLTLCSVKTINSTFL